MTDIHALSGAYALDALNDLERAEFERHLSNCAACREEVAGLGRAASELSQLSPAAPPADLRALILAGSRSVRPLPPQLTSHKGPSRRVATIAAAAALVVGLGAGATAIWRPWQPETVQLSLAEQIRQAPDAQTWSQTLTTGGRVSVVRSKRMGEAVWTTSGLSAAPEGRVYELWLQAPDESLTPAGLLSSGDGEVVLRGDAGTAIGAGLTEEPAGGSPAPTTTPIAFIDFRATS
jgi:anti-sigma factor RsiW